MNPITIKYLQAVCDRINRATNSPMQPYVGNVAQVGCYHLDGAYGGYALHRMSNASGGASDVFRCGHQPKRELANRMHAFLDGIQAVKTLDKFTE